MRIFTLGGGLDALTLTVQHDALAIVEYIGVDTLVNAGGNMPAFTVRFRDRVQNLVDNDGAIVYYAFTTGSVASYWSLTRTNLGTYRTAITPFPQAESYRMWVDTAAYGALAVVGANRFRVQALADSIVTFTGLETRAYVAAGDTLPSFTAAIVDKLGNPTDNSSLHFSYARSAAVGVIAAAPASSATVRSARLQTGLYRIESTVATIAGVYTYTLAGIPTHVGQRSVEVMPRTPASVDFVNVKEIVVAGQKQTAVQVTYRDRYGNLTDSLAPTQNRLWYSNSTDATVSSTESLTVSETLTQRVYTKTGVPLSGFPYRGIYDASNAVTFPAAGKYSLAVDGITTTTGTTAFEVVPNVDVRVAMEGLKDTITAGETLPTFTVRYFDVNGNPTDNTVGRVTYRHTTLPLVSTATIGMTRVSEGVYAVQSTQASLAGVYNMTVQGIPTANITGNKVFVVKGAIATLATFTISTSAMKAAGANVTISISYKDRYGNLTDNIAAVKVRNDEFNYTDTVTISKKSTGVYTASKTMPVPGEYILQLDTLRDPKNPTIQVVVEGERESFKLSPYPASRAVFSGVQASIVSGGTQAFTVELFDKLGAQTDYILGVAQGQEPSVLFSGAASGSVPAKFLAPNSPTDFNILTVETTPPFTLAGNYTFSIPYVLSYQDDPTNAKYTGLRKFAVIPNPTLTPQTTSIAFGGIPLQTSRTVSIPIRCIRLTQPITITVPSEFSVAVDGTTFQTGSVSILPPVGGTFTLTVQFLPTIAGIKSASITLKSGTATQNSIALTGRGVARTSGTNDVQMIDGTYYVNNQLFFPRGWSHATGIRPSYRAVDKDGNVLLNYSAPAYNGLLFSNNITTAHIGDDYIGVPGLNVVEFERFNGPMDVATNIKFTVTAPPGFRAADKNVNYENIDAWIEYLKIYLDFMNTKGVKVILEISLRDEDREFFIRHNEIQLPNKTKDINTTLRAAYDIATMTKFANAFKDHPAVLGWKSVGEMEHHFINVYSDIFKNGQSVFNDFSLAGKNVSEVSTYMKQVCDGNNPKVWYTTQDEANKVYNMLRSTSPNRIIHQRIQTQYFGGFEVIKNLYQDPAKPFMQALEVEEWIFPSAKERSRGEDNDSFKYEGYEVNLPYQIPNFPPAGENFKSRYYGKASPTYYMSRLKRGMRNLRQHLLNFPATAQDGGLTLKNYTLSPVDPANQSCYGETGRAATVAEQMYAIFSSEYWLQEPENSGERVMNVAGFYIWFYDCSDAPTIVQQNKIIRALADFQIGEALQQPKIKPDSVVQISAGNADQMNAIKPIVRQYALGGKQYYYVILVNTHDNFNGADPTSEQDQKAQAYQAVSGVTIDKMYR